MKPLFLAIAILVCPCVGQSTSAQEKQEGSKAIDAKDFFEPREYAGGDQEVLKYRLLKPANFDSAKKYPLVIFLHGAGERGDDNVAQLKHCMSELCTPQRREKYACYVIAPQCPKEQKWVDVDWSAPKPTYPSGMSRSLTLTFEVVDAMLEDAAIDKNRIYISGLSMGGYGTWDALRQRPDFFAAAVPICGGGNTAAAADFCKVPIWCFHGDDDKAVNVEKSRDMVAALKAAGGTPRYTEYPGVGHDSWTETYANDDMYQWLFGQRK